MFDYVNIIVYNGVVNVYLYGIGIVVNVINSWLYFSGLVSYGFYVFGNGIIYGKNLEYYFGGYCFSVFFGDGFVGYIYVEDFVFCVCGIGFVIYYVFGEIYVMNVVFVVE